MRCTRRFSDTNVVPHMVTEGQALRSKPWTHAVAGLVGFAVRCAIIGGAAALVYLAGAKTLALGIALAVIFIISLSLAYRRGWWTLIGPVFFFEMVRSARQTRNHAVRSLYGLIVFLTLLFHLFFVPHLRQRNRCRWLHIVKDARQTYG
jgi:hypothetical protein